MINQMTRVCTLARLLEANKLSLKPGVFKSFKKSVRNLKTEKSLKKIMLKSLAADNCDVLQFTIVETEDLAILDRFHKVDSSCVADLTHGGGQASKIKLCTNVALQTQDPTWNAQANGITSRSLNNAGCPSTHVHLTDVGPSHR